MTIPARPFYRHSDFEGALFADAFFGSLCRMAVAAIGIVCADSHYGGVLPFQPLFAPGHVCTGKERCRKKEGHTCWSTAPEFRPRNITYFIFKCSFGSNPPINVPSCPDGKKPTPILISRLSHVSSIVFRVDFQIAIRMVAVQTDAKLRPAPQIPYSEPTWQIHHTCRIIKNGRLPLLQQGTACAYWQPCDGFLHRNPGFSFTPLYCAYDQPFVFPPRFIGLCKTSFHSTVRSIYQDFI